MRDLRSFGIQACGTIRSNRKELPKDLLPGKPGGKLAKHAFVVAQRDGLTFVNWMDTKNVLTLSNFHDPVARGN